MDRRALTRAWSNREASAHHTLLACQDAQLVRGHHAAHHTLELLQYLWERYRGSIYLSSLRTYIRREYCGTFRKTQWQCGALHRSENSMAVWCSPFFSPLIVTFPRTRWPFGALYLSDNSMALWCSLPFRELDGSLSWLKVLGLQEPHVAHHAPRRHELEEVHRKRLPARHRHATRSTSTQSVHSEPTLATGRSHSGTGTRGLHGAIARGKKPL